MRTDLSVSLSNMNSLHSKSSHQISPFFASFWFLAQFVIHVFGEIEEGLLDKPADHSWIRPAAGDCRRFVIVFTDFMEKSLSQSIVASLLEAKVLVGVVPLPLLFDGVDVEDSFLLAVLDDFRGRGSHRKVYAEADLSKKDLIKDFLKIILCEANLEKFNLRVLLGEVNRIRVDDGHLFELKVPFDKGDSPSSDRAVPYHTNIIYSSVTVVAAHFLELLYLTEISSRLYSTFCTPSKMTLSSLLVDLSVSVAPNLLSSLFEK